MSFAYIRRGLFYLTGAFATAPVIAIFFGNQPVSVFNVLFLIFIFVLCLQASVSRGGFSYNWTAAILLFWFAWGLVASLFGLNYFSGERDWAVNIISYIPKLILFALLLVSSLKIENPYLFVSPFLKGLLAGFVANLVWATLEGLSFYIFDFVLNDWVFVAYANTLPSDRPTMTVVADGIIRAAGFNTDPAHLGGIIPVVVVYSMLRRSYFLLLLSLVALVFSGSTTALVCSILGIVASIGKLDVFNAKKRRFFNKSAVIYLSGIVVLVVVASFGDLVYEAVSRNAQGFYERITGVYVSSGDEGPRYIYHAYLPEAIDFNGIRTFDGIRIWYRGVPISGKSSNSKVRKYGLLSI